MADVFDLYYGSPGSAKTRSIIELIREMNKQTGKKARVYVGDGSLGLYTNSDLFKTGVIVPIQFDIHDAPFTTCQMICEGYWPKDAKRPNSGFRQLTPAEVSEAGMWVFEGASVMGNYMMGTKKGGLAQRAAAGEQLGQDANIKFSDEDGGTFGGNAPAHYNIAQRHLLANIIRSKALPGIVIWTAHERIDDGERGGTFSRGQTSEKIRVDEKTIGAELIGKALTGNIAREYGNTLHFTTATKKVQVGTDATTGKTHYDEQTEFRIYTRNHYDPDGIVGLMYRAVCRAIDPTKVKPYYVSQKPGEGLLEFYRDINASNQ